MSYFVAPAEETRGGVTGGLCQIETIGDEEPSRQ